MSTRPLTEKQAAIVSGIRRRVLMDGYLPTQRTLAADVGIERIQGLQAHLKALHLKGYIDSPHWPARLLRDEEGEPIILAFLSLEQFTKVFGV